VLSSNTINVASFIASVASLVLAVTAVWLSFRFFTLSSQSSNAIQRAASEIESGVNRLEALFEKMYSDTFGIVRDTYADIRKHAWPSEPEAAGPAAIEERAEEKVAELRQETTQQISRLMNEIGSKDEQIAALQALVQTAIDQSRSAEVEAREETLREAVLRALESGPMAAERLVSRLEQRGFDFYKAIQELQDMAQEGLVTWPRYKKEGRTSLGPDDRVTLTEQGSASVGALGS